MSEKPSYDYIRLNGNGFNLRTNMVSDEDEEEVHENGHISPKIVSFSFLKPI
jgi:hypothetical protein